MRATQDDAPVRKGDLLGGKYRVDRVLGAGGMGMVVSAVHVELGTPVALKFLLPHLVGEEGIARFQREARAVVRLKSEHVAKVLDIGRLKSGAPFLVMELLVGKGLERVLSERGPLPVAEAVGYVLQACEAIAEAHSLGIVHRDLKPQNMFLTQRVDGTPLLKVLDFGLAKTVAADDDHKSLTRTRDIMGSPVYMSPEQLRATKDVDGRTDVWSLGVCLFELLTTALPFEGTAAPEVCAAILKDPPRDVRSVRPDVPAALAAAIARSLEKDRTARYADVAALAEAIEPFAGDSMRGSGARIRAVLSSANRVVAPEPAAPLAAGETPTRADGYVDTELAFDTKPREVAYPLAAGVAALVVVAGIAAAAVWHARSAPSSGSAVQASAAAAPSASTPPVAATASETPAVPDTVPTPAPPSLAAAPGLDAGVVSPTPRSRATTKRPPPVTRPTRSDPRDHM